MSALLKRHWTLATVVILLLGIVWIWVSTLPPGGTTSGVIPAPQEGFQAPDFVLNTLEGETITLSDLRGKAILLNFWILPLPIQKCPEPNTCSHRPIHDESFVLIQY